MRKRHTKGRKVRSVGIVISDSKHGLTIALSTDHKVWGGYIFIPHVNITSIKKVAK